MTCLPLIILSTQVIIHVLWLRHKLNFVCNMQFGIVKLRYIIALTTCFNFGITTKNFLMSPIFDCIHSVVCSTKMEFVPLYLKKVVLFENVSSVPILCDKVCASNSNNSKRLTSLI